MQWKIGKNMVSKIEILKKLFNLFPPFEKFFEDEIDKLWGEDLGIHMNMSSFSNYIIDLIANDSQKNHQKEIELTFIFMEQLMNEGSEEVQEAVATCFLENLLNAVSWETIPASSFVPLLGPESKKHCKAWDEFTGHSVV